MYTKLRKWISVAVITLVIGALSTHTAHAIDWLGIGHVSNDLLSEALSWLSQQALYVASQLMAISGIALNVSLNLSLHIRDFVSSSQGVYEVWQTIRDISGMFAIFALLYASFKIILGFDNVGGAGKIIKNVIIAGILINFSFFLTSAAIDASNIVSLAIYKGIVGNQNSSGINVKLTVEKAVSTSNADTNLSDIFFQLLKPQTIYDPKSAGFGSGSAKPLLILLQGVVGCIIMFTTAMSFFIASLAFFARLGILIVLLAFSPVWFASTIVPKLDDYSNKFSKMLTEQLIFMPVYLLLLYAAIKMLTVSTIFSNPGTNIFTGTGDSLKYLPTDLIILVINDFFIIFMLNLPLFVGLSMSGTVGSMVNKFNAVNAWKTIGGWSRGKLYQGAGATWSNTGGRAASAINNSERARSFYARNPNLGQILNKNVGKIGANYDKSVKAQEDEMKKLYKQIGTVNRTSYKNDDDFKEAQKAAKKAQEVHLETLAGSSVMSFMLGNRKGNLGAKVSIEKTNKLKNLAKQRGEIKDRMQDNRNKLNKLVDKYGTAASINEKGEVEFDDNDIIYNIPESEREIMRNLAKQISDDRGKMNEIDDYIREENNTKIAGGIKIDGEGKKK